MSDEKSTVTIPVSEYQKLQSDTLACYGRAESAERQAKALQAERDGETISAAVRAVAERVGVRPEAVPDAVAMLAPGLRVEGGMVRVKGQPEADLGAHLEGFFQARPHWVQSPKASSPGRPAVPSTPSTTPGFMTGVPVTPPPPTFKHNAASLTTMVRRLTYPSGRLPGER
jgi:hypothetical protein